MSTVAIILPKDGTFLIEDFNLSPEELIEPFVSWMQAKDAAEADWDQGRYDHHDRWTGPALQSAVDEVREALAFRFDSLAELEAFAYRVNVAVEAARRAEAGAA